MYSPFDVSQPGGLQEQEKSHDVQAADVKNDN